MNLLNLLLIGLRGAALGLELQGQTKSAGALFGLADAAEAGRNVDAHMAAVAAKLKDRAATDADWQETVAAIEADSARLQG